MFFHLDAIHDSSVLAYCQYQAPDRWLSCSQVLQVNTDSASLKALDVHKGTTSDQYEDIAVFAARFIGF